MSYCISFSFISHTFIFCLFLAIRSLDTLNKRIDAFRTSDVWLTSPILKQTSTNNNQNPPPNCGATSLTRDCNFKNQNSTTTNANNTRYPPPSSSSLSHASLESSVALIQNLLVDTQRQCTKMVRNVNVLIGKFLLHGWYIGTTAQLLLFCNV